MTTYGVTLNGFVPKPLDQIKADIEDDLRTSFGADIDLSPNEPFGQLVGVVSRALADAWDLAEGVYDAAYPDSAEGSQLDDVCAITGTIRKAATKSTLTATLVGTNGTVVPQGTQFSVTGAGTKFATDAAATIATLGAWAGTTGYAVGALKTNDTGKIYFCTQAGTSAGSGGPTGTGTGIVDGSCVWSYIATGTAAVNASCSCTVTGAKVAPAGTLTVIETPVAGLASVKNALDGVQGRDIETDAALRLRREQELRAEGNAALDAIRSDVLLVAGVVSVSVFENTTDTTDVNGLPPHSVEVLVLGGADADIRAAIFASVAAGIATYGGVSGTVVDASGNNQTVKFSRPTSINIYVTVELTTGSDYPATGDADVKQDLVNYSLGLLLEKDGVTPVFKGYGVGDDVNAWVLAEAVTTVAGVKRINAIKIGTAPSPAGTADVAIGTRELAIFDTSRIVVTHV